MELIESRQVSFILYVAKYSRVLESSQVSSGIPLYSSLAFIVKCLITHSSLSMTIVKMLRQMDLNGLSGPPFHKKSSHKL
jgi:hypothetical protein